MVTRRKSVKRRAARPARVSRAQHKTSKTKNMRAKTSPRKRPEELMDPRALMQLKQYDDAVRYFNQQKLQRAIQEFEKVIAGPNKELADRARVHHRVCQQRLSRAQESQPRSAEDHYHRGISMMNLGRWDEAREHLERARKLAPKADFVHYAMAALECLVGESDAALQNLRVAIDLRPENRYHARNDEDFSSLFEDPRFTELLYPERDSVMP
jgi:tetratricopeptide (TPR) repeat protein